MKNLCTPSDKNAEGVLDDDTHLRVDTLKADLLLAPSNKDLSSQPLPPSSGIDVDHYKCYRVKVTAGTPRLPKGITVSVGDQFNAPPKLFELKKPRHLRAPADKNGEGIKNPDVHLFCYTVKGVKGQPKHLPQTGVQTNNQFGPEMLRTLKENELCIPSKDPSPVRSVEGVRKGGTPARLRCARAAAPVHRADVTLAVAEAAFGGPPSRTPASGGGVIVRSRSPGARAPRAPGSVVWRAGFPAASKNVLTRAPHVVVRARASAKEGFS